MNNGKKKCAVFLFWIALWFGIAVAVNNKILMATPWETVSALFSLLGERKFYVTVLGSLLRIGAGFFAGALSGMLLAAVSRRYPLVEELLSPAVNLMKAVPAASFVVLLLIWWGSSFLATAVCFLVVLPHLYISTLEGLKNMDVRLLEMAQVFRLPFRNRFFYLYRPALRPFLRGSLKISLGMCWKSGVAAELIGTPDYSIGERLYLSKVYLDTAGVFAWTAVIVLLSLLFEKAVLRMVSRFFVWEPVCGKPGAEKTGREGRESTALILTDVAKGYGVESVLEGVNSKYEPGKIYYLTSPSGSGKTTLLRILAGLEKPDAGSVSVPAACGMLFQEDRLCEEYSALKNVELVTGEQRRAEEALAQLLGEEAMHKPCSQLSGGMKRRAALVRAMEADSEYVLLDEPFTGMDAATRGRAEHYILERQRGRTLIIATHIL